LLFAAAGGRSVGFEGRKVFFFEKKKQKTFARGHPWPKPQWATYAKEQKFFGSFFQKRTTSFSSPAFRFALAKSRGVAPVQDLNARDSTVDSA
jgi:hypothetical protein